MSDQQQGAFCPTASAIVPLHGGPCDWCGQEHDPQYVFVGPPLGGWTELKQSR